MATVELEAPQQVTFFNLQTHNGCITMRNLTKGTHRTFKVWTQSDDANFMPGKRLVGLLTGPDNTQCFRSFGVLGDDGQIYLWKKHRGQYFYEWAANALMHPDEVADQVDILFEGHCRRCNRVLTDPVSIEIGLGPTCREIAARSA
jgi:hypothetical protein